MCLTSYILIWCNKFMILCIKLPAESFTTLLTIHHKSVRTGVLLIMNVFSNSCSGIVVTYIDYATHAYQTVTMIRPLYPMCYIVMCFIIYFLIMWLGYKYYMWRWVWVLWVELVNFNHQWKIGWGGLQWHGGGVVRAMQSKAVGNCLSFQVLQQK